MMGVGLLEMVILLFAVLIFLKPEEIPRFFRMLGRLYGQIFHVYQQVMRQINLSDVDFSYYQSSAHQKKEDETAQKSPQKVKKSPKKPLEKKKLLKKQRDSKKENR